MVKAIYFDYEGATIYRMTPIGDRLRKLRKTLGLNQGAVADHVGVTQATVDAAMTPRPPCVAE